MRPNCCYSVATTELGDTFFVNPVSKRWDGAISLSPLMDLSNTRPNENLFDYVVYFKNRSENFKNLKLHDPDELRTKVFPLLIAILGEVSDTTFILKVSLWDNREATVVYGTPFKINLKDWSIRPVEK